MSDPILSIVVPTFNRRDWLKRLLLNLEQQADDPATVEVVVTVDGATDGTLEMLADLRTTYSLRVLPQANSGPAAARNRALAAARGQVVLFLDDDVVPTAGLLEAHLAIHRRDPAAVVIGPVLPPPDGRLTPWGRWEAGSLRKHYQALAAGREIITPRQFYTGNASVAREHALAIGGFDESFTRAEDVDFGFRLAERGLRFYFAAEGGVLHESDHTFEQWLRIPYLYGRHDVLMAERRQRVHLLRLAYKERHGRHPLNRLLPRWCVGHTWRSRAVLAPSALAIRAPLPAALQPLQVLLCSALFNLLYWQGVADAMGVGSRVWQELAAQTADARLEQATSAAVGA